MEVDMATIVRCECGKFQAEVTDVRASTGGRAVCYCDDCQSFLHHIGRAELLDKNGGTEVIPTFPSSIKITAGREQLRCTRLSPRGLYRFSTACCKTPVANLTLGAPWAGLSPHLYNFGEAGFVERNFGPIKSRIMAKFAYGDIPKEASPKMGLRDIAFVAPFLLKGFLLGKKSPSPFFEADGKTPIVTPEVISLEARTEIRKKISDRLGKQ